MACDYGAAASSRADVSTLCSWSAKAETLLRRRVKNCRMVCCHSSTCGKKEMDASGVGAMDGWDWGDVVGAGVIAGVGVTVAVAAGVMAAVTAFVAADVSAGVSADWLAGTVSFPSFWERAVQAACVGVGERDGWY